MKFDQGKVKDIKRFLYHAIQANYDLGELEKARQKAKSQEEKDWIEEAARAQELRIREHTNAEREKQELITSKQQTIVRKWISENSDNVIFEEVYDDLKNGQYKFWFDRLILKAREQRLKPIEVLKSGKLSYGDLISFGVWYKVVEIIELEVDAVC